MLKSQRLTFLNSVDISYMVIQIVPLNIVKVDGGMFCCGIWKKSVCYNSHKSDGSSGSCILNSLLSSFLDKCWYLMMKAGWQRIFSLNLGPKQHNGTDDTRQGIRNPRIRQRERKIASSWHVWSSFFLFLFYFTPENINGGNVCVESSSAALFSISWECSSENIWVKEMSQVLLFAKFIL